jgi:hypothetical protein
MPLRPSEPTRDPALQAEKLEKRVARKRGFLDHRRIAKYRPSDCTRGTKRTGVLVRHHRLGSNMRGTDPQCPCDRLETVRQVPRQISKVIQCLSNRESLPAHCLQSLAKRASARRTHRFCRAQRFRIANDADAKSNPGGRRMHKQRLLHLIRCVAHRHTLDHSFVARRDSGQESHRLWLLTSPVEVVRKWLAIGTLFNTVWIAAADILVTLRSLPNESLPKSQPLVYRFSSARSFSRFGFLRMTHRAWSTTHLTSHSTHAPSPPAPARSPVASAARCRVLG